MSTRVSYVFSGHQTFVLRASWLKRLYDVLLRDPRALTSDDAVVQLGVGKNMVEAIRYWAQMTGMITSVETDKGWQPTAIAHTLFADNGLDPFVVTAWTRWWLHWSLVKSPAYMWRHVFMRLTGNDINVDAVVRDVQNTLGSQGIKTPAIDVLRRDVNCLLRCYLPHAPSESLSEDLLLCPLISLELLQPHDDGARLVSTSRDDLPDSLVVAAIADAMQQKQTQIMPFSELMWGEYGPGRLFRMSEDALLDRVARLDGLTHGAASYSDHGGVRAVQWADVSQVDITQIALGALQSEVAR
jgi:hypothetical protein